MIYPATLLFQIRARLSTKTIWLNCVIMQVPVRRLVALSLGPTKTCVRHFCFLNSAVLIQFFFPSLPHCRGFPLLLWPHALLEGYVLLFSGPGGMQPARRQGVGTIAGRFPRLFADFINNKQTAPPATLVINHDPSLSGSCWNRRSVWYESKLRRLYLMEANEPGLKRLLADAEMKWDFSLSVCKVMLFQVTTNREKKSGQRYREISYTWRCSLFQYLQFHAWVHVLMQHSLVPLLDLSSSQLYFWFNTHAVLLSTRLSLCLYSMCVLRCWKMLLPHLHHTHLGINTFPISDRKCCRWVPVLCCQKSSASWWLQMRAHSGGAVNNFYSDFIVNSFLGAAVGVFQKSKRS